MTRLLATAVVAVAGLTAAWPAHAQDRGFTGVFGGRGETERDQRLDLLATLVQAYDDDLLAETGLSSPGGPTLGGSYAMFQGAMEYSWKGRRVQVGATGTTAWRYYGHTGRVQSQSHAGGLGLSAALPGRITLFANQSVAYSPAYMYGLFPSGGIEPGIGESPPAAADYLANPSASSSYQTTTSFRRRLTRRGALSISADYLFTDFAGGAARLDHDTGPAGSDLTSYGLRAEFAREVGRRSSISTGYFYRGSEFGRAPGATTAEHGVELGLGHTKVLSASRRAQFALSLGVSVGDAPLTLTPATDADQFYRLTGGASVTYEFGRSWDFDLAYRRRVAYVAELTQPVFTDGLTASVGGLLTRKLDIRIATGYTSGESLLYTASAFDTYTGSVRSRWTLTRTLGVLLEYLYYFYDFGGSALVAPGLSPRLERHSVRGGLTLWVPAFRK